MKKGKVSEELARAVLEGIGFEIVSTNEEVKIGDRTVAEIDLLANAPCSKYAVEVKSGKIDVSAVRQAYANAKVIGATPMVMGTGWSNEEAYLMAKELGVKYLLFEDIYVSTREEVFELVSQVLESFFSEILGSLAPCEECCKIANLEKPNEEAIKIVRELKSKGLLPKRGNWRLYSTVAKLNCLLYLILHKQSESSP
ncbi:hypothetical protein EYM_00950 [Ignicoccus islandicus DSM 13165]|uniref:Endonuclease n=1 Tax=Ignicoccus islandicus DSM 13165 TaxID=940295 RepID=A0A0U3EA25_9CREN|nr:hypothetical protein [Ignicoccus islandicus]ALU12158.1 hypothetical protein EYM_00950 [Ignicoccus islandicus DSM 13165]